MAATSNCGTHYSGNIGINSILSNKLFEAAWTVQESTSFKDAEECTVKLYPHSLMSSG